MTTINNLKGYTEVWGGSPEELLAAAVRWQSLMGSDKLKTINEEGYCVLSVANECIDWSYYRENDEYVLLGEKTKRSSRGKGNGQPILSYSDEVPE